MKLSTLGIVLALVTVVLLPTTSSAQVRDCVQRRSNVEMGFDDATSAIQVRSGKSCNRGADFPGFRLQRFEIVEQPRHGTLVHRGRGRHDYKAKPGYTGSDSFKIRWVGDKIDFRTGQTLGPTSFGARTAVTVVQ